MTPDILAKLSALLERGITSEESVVYLLVGIRKLLEREPKNHNFENLQFYCDWALHSEMDRNKAKEILALFEIANYNFEAGLEYNKLPSEVRGPIENVSKLAKFKEELDKFLGERQLPRLTFVDSEGWVKFLHLYARVVEDCPLVLKTDAAQRIKEVRVNVEEAKQHPNGQFLFRVVWTMTDQNDKKTSIPIYNSFDITI